MDKRTFEFMAVLPVCVAVISYISTVYTQDWIFHSRVC